MLAVQLLGFIGLLAEVWSLQPKFRRNILTFRIISNLFWVAHFALLGAFTGAALNTVGVFRAYTFQKFGSKKLRSPIWLYIMVLLCIGAGIVTWKSAISFLPMAAMVIFTLGLWQRNEQTIRKIALIAAPLWLIYNLFVGSYIGVINEIFVIISALIALYRFRNRDHQVIAVAQR